ncbi:YqcI/YcgG family protein [Mechercharimyces sp. CAU 1602]|uniref:YqcI/YcgG family protein n=1 Tax=Mechercharimyces sp. CAU 1602 TaxID=2973933 RepID=UPI002163A2D2|nr:YqcI/YcgG family protein [Mechercharimyces sp. CAU 1602]MCS1349990.1 YqcI/YcgG family protein [Mechercharimyces sp. CAU 1602]
MMYQQTEIARFAVDDWRKDAFLSFREGVLSPSPKFPCIFATQGLKEDEMRFSFYESDDDEAVKSWAQHLRLYLSSARQLGKYTSYVSFFNLPRDQSLCEYESIFWSIVNRLHRLDEVMWPQERTRNTDSPYWEFIYHGEPIFVVCNTPAYKGRKSRKSSTFLIAVQPAWVFEHMGLLQERGKKAIRVIRQLLQQYDDHPVFPYLGLPGEENNREWMQYFIPETNELDSKKIACPFAYRNDKEQEGAPNPSL